MPKGTPRELTSILKKELAVENPLYISALKHGRSTRFIPRYIKTYKEEEGALFLPRGIILRLRELANILGIELQEEVSTILHEKKVFDKQINLYDYQKPLIEEVLKSHQGVILAPPGAGKTICGIKLYEVLGQPCLWITHTKRLANQTASRVKEFLGIETGLIGDGKDKIEHFTVGIVSSLIRKDLSRYKDLYGLVITDECHHLPAKSFIDVCSQFPAHYRYGLTATPYRDDGLEPLIFQVKGPTLASLDKEELRRQGLLMRPTVVRRSTKFKFDYDPYDKKFNYQALEEALLNDELRNRQIISDVLVESTFDENVCIVLVNRIEHGDILYEMLKDVISDVGFVHSKMTTKQSNRILDSFEAGEIKILVATYQMLAEGFDYKPSNRLFLTAPVKGRTRIEQACGRVERVSPGKKSAVIYDYIDTNVGVLERQADIRLETYEQNNLDIITTNKDIF